MYITYLIIGATTLVSIMAFSNPDIKFKLSHWPHTEAQRGEYHRWLTSGFLHGDALHLIFNMMTLFFLGGYVEAWFRELIPSVGGLFYLLFYLVSIAASSAATFFKHRHNPGFMSIGASGGTAAVLFAAILLHPTIGIGIMFIPIPIPGFILGFLYLWYSSYAANHSHDNIDHTAHFYGALFGFIFPAVLDPFLIPAFFDQISVWISTRF